MKIQKAKDHYLGKNGCERLNCARSVVEPFRDRLALAPETLEHLASCGGGKAPEGYCGAIHAALMIANKEAPGKVQEIKDFFTQNAGSLKCREIKAHKKMLCLDCIGRAAEFLIQCMPLDPVPNKVASGSASNEK